ncbi:carotenoid biosynthesis protein [Marinicrinis sediminis]|uniref:Carotenoid biosynthesis protein n=1 Tax=Marinicrinis sediminis TaxID=1652465 RepID=A0ABW5R707_9BACL
MISKLYWFWYLVGLLLMSFYHVPSFLSFSNGLFLIFLTLHVLTQYHKRIAREQRTALYTTSLVIFLSTFLLEWIGTETGFPFGDYHYTSVLGLSLFGVPLAIACAWIAILLMARSFTPIAWSRPKRAAIAALYAVALDLVLDPAAHAMQFWQWAPDQWAMYDVPFQNFAAWYVTAFVLLLLLPIPDWKDSPTPLVRTYQGLLIMFGVLCAKHGMPLLLLAAAGWIAIVEWREKWRGSHAHRKQTKVV